MELLLSSEQGHDCTIVAVTGDLDLSTSHQLRRRLQTAIEEGARQVVVDLGGVGFMDSSALGMLVVTFKQLRNLGGRLCLAAPRGITRTVIEITAVDKAIDVYDTVAEAEASAAGR
ncbi:anti-sigma B factor antagonist [Allocatelliglobosispora scoriae]|uniref:Anti-sigma factor antagonist n=1 Tax=Allocatelliglobosispora scoriae TaxID=643052 RepID=A0A841BEX5_9ACTN|nr:STAS domain-containing protein [Allocatelliglobosispora scoriae]MBB5867637.1 anti-sigma B factor antagonist [Allocatelliglobosispora scoriae]